MDAEKFIDKRLRPPLKKRSVDLYRETVMQSERPGH